jgi:hypothetical protein
MNEKKNATSLKEKLDSYLDRACEAEVRGDYSDAERLFRMALYCEGLLRPDVGSAREYVKTAGPVYPDARSQVEQGITGGHNETKKAN